MLRSIEFLWRILGALKRNNLHHINIFKPYRDFPCHPYWFLPINNSMLRFLSLSVHGCIYILLKAREERTGFLPCVHCVHSVPWWHPHPSLPLPLTSQSVPVSASAGTVISRLSINQKYSPRQSSENFLDKHPRTGGTEAEIFQRSDFPLIYFHGIPII